ncbi:hypothetical protein AAG895_01190 [Thauera sp. JM12B12]|uniref:hypothetical protein n=1 Tax=Thauera sp. JM12B12 TaxID=3142262 RepID=UPI0031F3DDBF
MNADHTRKAKFNTLKYVPGVLLFAVVAFIVYFGFTWRISNSSLDQYVQVSNVFNVASGIFQLELGLDFSKIIRKDSLDWYDALFNAVSLYISSFTILPFYIAALIGSFFYAIFAGEFFGAVLIAIIGSVVCVFIPFYPIALWGLMFFQPGSGSYHVVWLLIGLPVISLGMASIYPAVRMIIIIIIPK